MLKRFVPPLLIITLFCLGTTACEQKKTQAELQAQKVTAFRQQQKKKAIMAYKDLITKYADSEFAAQAKERLQKLQPAGTPEKK